MNNEKMPLPDDREINLWLEMGSPETFKNVSVSDMACALKFFWPKTPVNSEFQMQYNVLKQLMLENAALKSHNTQLMNLCEMAISDIVVAAGEVMRERCADTVWMRGTCTTQPNQSVPWPA